MSIKRWGYDGVVLPIGQDGYDGQVSLEDLKELIQAMEDRGETLITVDVDNYCLRVTRVEGEGGPRMVWG